MNTNSLIIQDANFPNILINGNHYDLFCQYVSKTNQNTDVYISDARNDAVIILDSTTAVSGLYSIEPTKVSALLDYIEATLSRKSGLICFSKADMDLYLKRSDIYGGKHPLLQLETMDRAPSLFQKAVSGLKPQKRQDPTFVQKIQEHTVQVKHSDELSPMRFSPTLEDALIRIKEHSRDLDLDVLEESYTIPAPAIKKGLDAQISTASAKRQQERNTGKKTTHHPPAKDVGPQR